VKSPSALLLGRWTFDFSAPWLRTEVAASYVGCKTVRAFYDWKRRHPTVVSNGRVVSRASLDRALKMKRIRRMNPASLQNLRRHIRQPNAVSLTAVTPVLGESIQ